jgi:chitodextrinase
VNSKCGARRHALSAIVAMGALCAVGSAQAAAWMPDVFYTAGTVVSYNGQNYTALVSQTDYTATGWNPTTASLWTPSGTASGGGTTTPPAGGGGTTTTPPAGGGTSTGSCAAAWSASQVYTGGNQASENGTNYTANWWTQGNDPATNSGPWEVASRGPRLAAALAAAARLRPPVEVARPRLLVEVAHPHRPPDHSCLDRTRTSRSA